MGGRQSFIAKLINNTVAKLVTWFKTTQLTETDAKKLVSFFTGEVCCDEKVNINESMAVGLSIL